MKFPTAVLFALALIVGVAVGYMFNPSVETPQPESPRVKTHGSVKDEGDAATIAALRSRIAALEAKLAEKRGEAPAEAAKTETREERRGPGSHGEWLKKVKDEDPARYAQITNSMARHRQARLSRAIHKIDFLSSLDLSSLPEAARKVHDELQAKIEEREALEELMHERRMSGEEESEEERAARFESMRATDRAIRELNVKERQNLLSAAVEELGFSGEQAKDVTESIQEIIEATEGGWNSTGRPGRNNNGGDMPPPPPR